MLKVIVINCELFISVWLWLNNRAVFFHEKTGIKLNKILDTV